MYFSLAYIINPIYTQKADKSKSSACSKHCWSVQPDNNSHLSPRLLHVGNISQIHLSLYKGIIFCSYVCFKPIFVFQILSSFFFFGADSATNFTSHTVHSISIRLE